MNIELPKDNLNAWSVILSQHLSNREESFFVWCTTMNRRMRCVFDNYYDYYPSPKLSFPLGGTLYGTKVLIDDSVPDYCLELNYKYKGKEGDDGGYKAKPATKSVREASEIVVVPFEDNWSDIQLLQSMIDAMDRFFEPKVGLPHQFARTKSRMKPNFDYKELVEMLCGVQVIPTSGNFVTVQEGCK